MKATKKIVGAACALVAAVALSAGSTYAWFAANNEVSADGMTVSAVSPANLLIAEGYQTDIASVTKSSIQMGLSVTEMWPVAISTTKVTTGTAIAEGTATGTEVEDGQLYAYDATFTGGTAPGANEVGTPTGYTEVGDGKVGATGGFKWTSGNGTSSNYDASLVSVSGKNYVAGYNMTIGNMAQTVDIDATIKITWTTSDNTNKFVRAGLLISADDGETYTFYSAPNTSSASGQSLEFEYEKILEDFDDGDIATVTLFVWYDGNDADCYAANARVKASLSVTVTYSVNSGD